MSRIKLSQLQAPVQGYPASFSEFRMDFHVSRDQIQFIITVKLNKIILKERTVIRKTLLENFLKNKP